MRAGQVCFFAFAYGAWLQILVTSNAIAICYSTAPEISAAIRYCVPATVMHSSSNPSIKQG